MCEDAAAAAASPPFLSSASPPPPAAPAAEAAAVTETEGCCGVGGRLSVSFVAAAVLGCCGAIQLTF